MSRTCSQCGNNGHNSRTCTDTAAASGGGESQRENSIMLFGVRVTEGKSNIFRKSVSMTNLSQYEHQTSHEPNAVDAGYVSDDVVHASGRSRERKRGVPWTEEEHKFFLLGLSKVGKGDWRGISRNFVKTRTPTQVASHAQKYFLRLHNHSRRRRRSSLFDITTYTVMKPSTIMEEEEEQVVEQEKMVPHPPTSATYPSSHYGASPGSAFPTALSPVVLPVTEGERSGKAIRPTPILPVPPSSKMASLNLKDKTSRLPLIEPPLPLSLKLPPLPLSKDQSPTTSSHSSSSSIAFQPRSSGKFNGGRDNNIISVA
ncbi:hypothetical protein Lal_00025980 [Lupinus albus]|uniref:Putative transcription factor MYB-HB-like family n=1 Tax=Lupinus albus TaxID=3870 RepID=A0A6A5LN69_LUPAL|nr:putative transcription factor MYB-HB-like family [Lupinus albus]KAF1861598.1 hypothetical protein Lal_00025980 [Lupinus albus]